MSVLEKRLAVNPYGPPATSNRDDNWSAAFAGGFVISVVGLVAL
ncbi:hypothetical protein ACIBLA_31080 [Streptomyces sp. NPDC050433]